jgi:hypothetical protein
MLMKNRAFMAAFRLIAEKNGEDKYVGSLVHARFFVFFVSGSTFALCVIV